MSRKKKKTAKDVMLPHSKAKVAFYREYLTRFLSIMSVSKFCEKVNIFDLFCGRGVYADGGHGSPIQAMETIQRVRQDHPSNTEIRLYLNDLVKNNVDGVKEYICTNFSDDLCSVKYLNAPAANLFSQLPTFLRRTPPESKNLFFIDPYGYKEIHKNTLYELLDNGRTEILLFLPISFMHRFTHYAFDGNANKSAQPLKEFISEFFPEDHPVRGDQPMDVKQYIKELAKAFSFGGRFLTTSYIIQRDCRNYFAVFYMTSNWLGLERAVDSIWALDNGFGQGFWLEDENKGLLLFDDTVFEENRRRSIHEQIRFKLLGLLQKQPRSNSDLYRYFLQDGYTISRITPVLKELQNNNQIVVVLNGTDTPARKGAFYLNYKEAITTTFPRVEIRLAA